MPVAGFPRCLLVLVLSCLCCACSTPEQRADAAFAELCERAAQVRAQLASVKDAESAQQSLEALEEQAEALRDVLTRLDELADDPALTPDARQRVGERHREPLREVTRSVLEEAVRLVRHGLYQCEGLNRLARREFAHYAGKRNHPWPRAVLSGREYRPRREK